MWEQDRRPEQRVCSDEKWASKRFWSESDGDNQSAEVLGFSIVSSTAAAACQVGQGKVLSACCTVSPDAKNRVWSPARRHWRTLAAHSMGPKSSARVKSRHHYVLNRLNGFNGNLTAKASRWEILTSFRS